LKKWRCALEPFGFILKRTFNYQAETRKKENIFFILLAMHYFLIKNARKKGLKMKNDGIEVI
jgi:hypothetical protein